MECLDKVIELALRHGGEYTAGDAQDRLNARVLGRGPGCYPPPTGPCAGGGQLCWGDLAHLPESLQLLA